MNSPGSSPGPVTSWHLRRFNVFDKFDSAELEEVTRILHVQEFRRRDPVFLPSDEPNRIYFLFKGRVKVSRIDPESGKELILYLIRPGELFGILPRARDRYAATSAVALQRSLIGFIRRRDFNRLSRQRDLHLEISKAVGARAVTIESRLEELLFRDVTERMARLLLRLAREFPGSSRHGDLIDVQLTQQDLADLIGSTRESASLTLNQFKRDGIVRMERRRVVLCDKPALKSLAGR